MKRIFELKEGGYAVMYLDEKVTRFFKKEQSILYMKKDSVGKPYKRPDFFLVPVRKETFTDEKEEVEKIMPYAVCEYKLKKF